MYHRLRAIIAPEEDPGLVPAPTRWLKIIWNSSYEDLAPSSDLQGHRACM